MFRVAVAKDASQFVLKKDQRFTENAHAVGDHIQSMFVIRCNLKSEM